jgi:hypothetical protein
VKSSSLASKPGSLVCPSCEVGKLQPSTNGSMRCGSCGDLLDRMMLETLEQIAVLPDALGAHACECGHPEMRLLPDGTFHCPGCGSEVLSLKTFSTSADVGQHSEAYRSGWIHGRYAELGCFTENANLVRWQGASNRLDYYRGHRAGREARRAAISGRLPKAVLNEGSRC